MLTRTQQAEFRPLVDRAWRAQCVLTGRDPTNRLARDAWYRDQLQSVCGIQSTKAATEADYAALLTWFNVLTSSDRRSAIVLAGVTPAQNAIFQKLSWSAWKASTARGHTADGYDTWVDQQLEECNAGGRQLANHVGAFDGVLSHFAIIAGDMYWIDRTSAAAERRMRWQIERILADLSELLERVLDWEYCRAIYDQMSLPMTIDETPAKLLWKVLQALDTHRRRVMQDPCAYRANPGPSVSNR